MASRCFRADREGAFLADNAAMNAPAINCHSGFSKSFLPCKNVGINRINQRSIQVKN